MLLKKQVVLTCVMVELYVSVVFSLGGSQMLFLKTVKLANTM